MRFPADSRLRATVGVFRGGVPSGSDSTGVAPDMGYPGWRAVVFLDRLEADHLARFQRELQKWPSTSTQVYSVEVRESGRAVSEVIAGKSFMPRRWKHRVFHKGCFRFRNREENQSLTVAPTAAQPKIFLRFLPLNPDSDRGWIKGEKRSFRSFLPSLPLQARCWTRSERGHRPKPHPQIAAAIKAYKRFFAAC